eukprot:scaffold95172_cov30-Tisochrysis_lutea.AAC.1
MDHGVGVGTFGARACATATAVQMPNVQIHEICMDMEGHIEAVSVSNTHISGARWAPDPPRKTEDGSGSPRSHSDA